MATTTTAASAIRQAFTGEVIDNVFRNRTFFDLFPMRQASGAASERWSLVQTGQTGATFNEGGAFSAPDNNTYAAPAIAKNQWQSTYSYSAALDQDLAIGESRVFNAIGLEAEANLKAVFDAAMATMLGSTGMGWELAVDSTGTYAGLARGSTTGWDASENALGGALTIAALQNAQETLVNVERAANPNVCFCAPNQLTNYLNLAGPGAGTSLVRYSTGPGQGVISANVGEDPSGARFGNQVIKPVRDMTTTVWLMTEMNLWRIVYWESPAWGSVRGVTVQEVPPSGHSKEINVAWTGALVHSNPFHSHKETGVTA